MNRLSEILNASFWLVLGSSADSEQCNLQKKKFKKTQQTISEDKELTKKEKRKRKKLEKKIAKRDGPLVKGKNGPLVKEKKGPFVKGKNGPLVKGKNGPLVKGKNGPLVKGKRGKELPSTSGLNASFKPMNKNKAKRKQQIGSVVKDAADLQITKKPKKKKVKEKSKNCVTLLKASSSDPVQQHLLDTVMKSQAIKSWNDAF